MDRVVDTVGGIEAISSDSAWGLRYYISPVFSSRHACVVYP